MDEPCRAASPGIVACWLGDVPDVETHSCAGSANCHTWDARTLDIEPDFFTVGVLVLYTRGVIADWVDVVITDLALETLTKARITEIEDELGGAVAELEVARKHVARGHAMIPGSSSFTIIRLSRVGRRI
jgi:hypothetical protein